MIIEQPQANLDEYILEENRTIGKSYLVTFNDCCIKGWFVSQWLGVQNDINMWENGVFLETDGQVGVYELE